MMEDLRSLVRRSITEKIVDPEKDLTEHKIAVRNHLSQEELSKLKFKLEVAVPIHLPPKSGKGTCRRVVDLVENEFCFKTTISSNSGFISALFPLQSFLRSLLPMTHF